jgi:acyl-CoA thioester hydrolase
MSLITYRGAVYPWHCDHVGHMNVMWYVGKFDEATWQLFNAIGLSPSYLRQSQRGMVYERELRAGDVLCVTSRILEVKERSIRFEHRMTNEETGEVAARTTLKGVHLDTQLRKSCAFADFVRDRATAMTRDATTASSG